jgi:hypothetical protein
MLVGLPTRVRVRGRRPEASGSDTVCRGDEEVGRQAFKYLGENQPRVTSSDSV